MEALDESVHSSGVMKLDSAMVANFRTEIRGQVITAEDGGYEEARKIWNGMVDKHPVMIVKCSGNTDVIRTVNFAKRNGLQLSVRGGGHNVAGNAICEGGVVVDLSLMKSVRVDPENRVARVGGGALLGDVDHETQQFALAAPLGVVSKTGVAGLTLNGGLGLLSRKYGLASDNLIGADVVTADGNLVVANEHQNTDLLWALRGGGGSFGVVTSFEFRLHPVGPDIFIAIVLYPVEMASRAIRFFRDFMSKAPDEVMGLALLWSSPDEEHIPHIYRGRPNIVLLGSYIGPVDEGEQALKPLRELAQPIADLSGQMPFVSAQQLFDADYPDGMRYYWKSTYLNILDDEVIQLLVDRASTRPSPISSLDVWVLGGAMARIDTTHSAFAQRSSPFMIGIESNWKNPAEDDANFEWARTLYQDLQKYSTGGVYLNFPGFAEEGLSMIKKTFGENYDRLVEVKQKYDPDNFFSSNWNIIPMVQ
jgi:FAD/FMN-containing dehydrogenase